MPNLITEKQFNQKEKELDRLKKEYEKLAKNISGIAKEGGSFLVKVPGYDSLMDKINILSFKISQLEKELASTKIVSSKEISSDIVSVLSCVSILDILKNRKEKYCFNGEERKDIISISQNSQIGKALLGKKLGDRVKVKTPKGERELEILKIEVPI